MDKPQTRYLHTHNLDYTVKENWLIIKDDKITFKQLHIILKNRRRYFLSSDLHTADSWQRRKTVKLENFFHMQRRCTRCHTIQIIPITVLHVLPLQNLN
jgi:hypothetical protein